MFAQKLSTSPLSSYLISEIKQTTDNNILRGGETVCFLGNLEVVKYGTGSNGTVESCSQRTVGIFYYNLSVKSKGC